VLLAPMLQLAVAAGFVAVGGAPAPADLACPAGTARRQASQGATVEAWCERPSGVREGPYRKVLNPQSRTEGAFRDGKKEGEWRELSGEAPITITHFRRGRQEGWAVRFYSDGSLAERWQMARGKRNGLHESWQRGVLESRGRYVDDREEGRYTEWDPKTGQLCSDGLYHRGEMIGSWTTCRNLGGPNAQGRYENGRREGTWVFSSGGTRTAEGRYHRGVRVGRWTYFLDDGKTPRARGGFRHGCREGRWILYDRTTSEAETITCKEGRPTKLWNDSAAIDLCSGEEEPVWDRDDGDLSNPCDTFFDSEL
jgi:antitoxin component YwqK of YwqJK toxin-antitoxin module